ncbi:MAG: N-acetylmuramoyl-L-alanine amidase-like domain-containing protein [Gemmatimonadales bacterium]
MRRAALAAAVLGLPTSLHMRGDDPDLERLERWAASLRAEGLIAGEVPFGRSVVRVGELAGGTPYEAGTLDAYLRSGGIGAAIEPLTLSLTRFDCVTLVESCLGVGRVAQADGPPGWADFAREVERMRYRGGERRGYGTRLHYFSEWIADGARRGLVRDLGPELGGVDDRRPLRFMTEHRASYPALADDRVFEEIGAMERRLDELPRRVIPTSRIVEASDQIATGDVLAFATAIPGLDVTHAAMAYRDREGALRVLHAPLSGGVVEVSRLTLPEYVMAIRRSTGVLVARPLRA